MSKVTYETRTETDGKDDRPRFVVDQFVGFWARWEAKRHARKLIKHGEAQVATVVKVIKVGTFIR